MRFAYSAEQERLRQEVQRFYSEILDADTRQQLASDPVGPTMRRVVKQMGHEGWLGIGWPTEFGGQGRGPVEQFIFLDESNRAGAPVPVISVNLVGPTLIVHGTNEQRDKYLPEILAGDALFCIGYSEPEAGTDLGSLTTAAVLDGDDLIVSGQKTWTSFYSCATYCWLAVRTDPAQKGLRGVSILIVPMDSPGITVTPLRLMNDHNIASVYFDEVRVPAKNIVGTLHGGVDVITTQLNHERTTMGSPGIVRRAFDEVREWARTTRLPSGGFVVDLPWVQQNLAQAYVSLELLKLMNWSNVDDAIHGRVAIDHVSATKVFGTEQYVVVLGLLLEILGPAALLKRSTDGAVLDGMLEELYRHHAALTFGGGANEVQRELVSQFGLGLARTR
jgi:3-oxocholest-4-en-26-oyl-CoA dehydrogenase alpha subunit